MNYLTIFIVLISISSVFSQDVYCEIDYTIPWSSQGCKSTSIYTSTCSSMLECLGFTTNSTLQLNNVVNTYIILKTDNYNIINDCAGQVGVFPKSENVIFDTKMDYVNIQCQPNQRFIDIRVNYAVNLFFNNFKFIYENQINSVCPITITNEDTSIIPNAFFTNFVVTNSVGNQGGFLSSMNYNVNVYNSIFTKCSASVGGAILSNGANSTVSVFNSTFIGCYAYEYGGAIFSANNIIAKNSTFSKNSCETSGGGALYGIKSVSVDNSIFESNNVKKGNGGALSTYGYVSISNSVFNQNNGNNGGAIYATYVYIDSSSFSDNYGDYGGVIYASETFSITRSNFVGNVARFNGGAILIPGRGTGSLDNSKFYKNFAYKKGGAIYTDSPTFISTFDFEETDFTNNLSNLGGAIYSKGYSAFYFYNSVFLGNTASVEAGSVYIEDPNNTKGFKITGGTFINSTSQGFINSTQTFNLAFLKTIGSVFIPTSYVDGPSIYNVPLVYDSYTAPYAKAYETISYICVYGVATIDLNGDVTSCTCFTGYTGKYCNIPNKNKME